MEHWVLENASSGMVDSAIEVAVIEIWSPHISVNICDAER